MKKYIIREVITKEIILSKIILSRWNNQDQAEAEAERLAKQNPDRHYELELKDE